MRSRRALAAIVLLWGCLLCTCCGSGSDHEDQAGRRARRQLSQPDRNLVLITIDTLRADALGCYGNPTARTPTADRLARTGVQFEHAYCAAPITLPSHTTLLTGARPVSHGIRNNGPYRVDSSRWHLAEHLREAGYETAGYVSAEPLHPRHGLDRGFGTYDCEFPARPGGEHAFAERPGNVTSGQAMGWVRGSAATPFFLWVHYFDPHAPYAPPRPFDTIAGGGYAGEVAYADYCLGALLGEIRAGGHDDSTAIVVTADHGEGLGDHEEPSHGLFVFDSTMRIPLLIRPAAAAADAAADDDGRSQAVATTPTAAIDIAPTALGLLGLTIPAELPGRDMSPALRARAGPPAEAGAAVSISGESAYGFLEYGWSPVYSLRRGPWKLVRAGGRDTLFNTRNDPAESTDLAAGNAAMTSGLGRELESLHADLRSDATTDPTAASSRLAALGYMTGAGRGITVPGPEDDDANGLRVPMDATDLMKGIQKAQRDASEGWSATAITQLRKLAVQDPSNPQLPFLLGRELRKLAGASETERMPLLVEAEAATRRAVELRPRFTRARDLRTVIQLQLCASNRAGYEDVRSAILEGIELGAASADTHFFHYLITADPQLPTYDREAASQALERCLALDPDHAEARALRGD